MNSKLNPYILFNDGKAREAMEFYKSVFGGELTLTTLKEGGMPHDPADDDKIMHASLVADNGITIMGADDTDKHEPASSNMSISLSGENEEELKGYWNKLSEGAKITMQMDKAPWGDIFGMLTDQFGIGWMVNITVPKTA